MPFPIHSRDARRRLEVRAKPYFARISDDVSIGYRKGKTVSRWVVRRYLGASRYRTKTIPGVQPDDEFASDGKKIISYQLTVNRIMGDEKIPVRCDFCNKNKDQVEVLIAGPKGFICNECVRTAQLYLDYYDDFDHSEERLLFEDGKPVIKDGKPVFEKIPEEARELRKRYDYDVPPRQT